MATYRSPAFSLMFIFPLSSYFFSPLFFNVFTAYVLSNLLPPHRFLHRLPTCFLLLPCHTFSTGLPLSLCRTRLRHFIPPIESQRMMRLLVMGQEYSYDRSLFCYFHDKSQISGVHVNFLNDITLNILHISVSSGRVMPSWFDVPEMPITANCLRDESSILKAVKKVHSMIDKEIAAGVDPKNVFLCGLSQGVLSGWVPFSSNTSIIQQITPEAKKTPILWCHGMADMKVLFEAGQAGTPFLQRAGIKCEFMAYPDLGHSLSDEELQHMESWIISHLSEIIPNHKNNKIYAQKWFSIFTQRRKREKEFLASNN